MSTRKWLVADGYEVDLIDPIARHVEQASSICRASLGDARHLDAAVRQLMTWSRCYGLLDPLG